MRDRPHKCFSEREYERRILISGVSPGIGVSTLANEFMGAHESHEPSPTGEGRTSVTQYPTFIRKGMTFSRTLVALNNLDSWDGEWDSLFNMNGMVYPDATSEVEPPSALLRGEYAYHEEKILILLVTTPNVELRKDEIWLDMTPNDISNYTSIKVGALQKSPKRRFLEMIVRTMTHYIHISYANISEYNLRIIRNLVGSDRVFTLINITRAPHETKPSLLKFRNEILDVLNWSMRCNSNITFVDNTYVFMHSIRLTDKHLETLNVTRNEIMNLIYNHATQ